MAEAREMAASIRKAIASGLDPSLALKASRRRDSTRESAVADQPTFRNAWDVFWGLKGVQVASDKDRQLWINMMERYALAFIGDRPVADIRAGEIIEMLRPIWTSKQETARKVLQRVDAVFTSAITREWRERASPCIVRHVSIISEQMLALRSAAAG